MSARTLMRIRWSRRREVKGIKGGKAAAQTGRTQMQPWAAVAGILLAWWCMGGVVGRRRISAVSHEWGDWAAVEQKN